MSSEQKQPDLHPKLAYGFHVAIALIVCLVLAMQIHLKATQTSIMNWGGIIFLMAIWLGAPGVALLILASYCSFKASETQLKVLTVVSLLLFCEFIFEMSMEILIPSEAFYVLLVIGIGLSRLLKRRNKKPN